MTQTSISYAFGGGLDVSSAALGTPSSAVISAMNYEPLAEGYGRQAGHERFDGRPAPSASEYWVVPFSAGQIWADYEAVITGATSGATGILIVEPADVTGSWPAHTATGLFIIGSLSGQFSPGEAIVVGGVVSATCAGIAAQNAPTDAQDKLWLRAASAWRRSHIQPVPGQGPVRGVTATGGTIYAWRDAIGGSSAKLHRATSSGWVDVAPSRLLNFSAGVVEFGDGDTLVGATSGHSATVIRVVRSAGDWGSTASGYLIFANGAPAFTFGEALKVGGVTVCTAGSATMVTFAAGGRYDTIQHNFYGAAALSRTYGAYGAGCGFEFDGVNVVPIQTGMLDDRPIRVFELANHLGFAFPGGSVQFSGTADPISYEVIVGAGEIGLGTEITDVIQSNESAVVLFGQTKIATLTGRDAASFQLTELTEEAGSEPWTAQRIGRTIYLDRRGLRDLVATQDYGNFKAGALAELIAPYFKSKRKSGATPVLSYVCREKSQYRLIWSDGTGLSVYMGARKPAAMPFEMNGMQPYCSCTVEMPDGTEGMFIGAEDGFVYRMDSGPSFDGVGVRGFIMTPFITFGSAQRNKRFHKLIVEMQAEPLTNIGITAQFNYGDGGQPVAGSQSFMVSGSGGGNDFVVQGGGGNWDSAMWDEFYWSAPLEGQAEAFIDGQGRNASFIIAARSAIDEGPHILQAYTPLVSMRGFQR